MLSVRYYRADSSTYVIKSANGKAIRQGKGLSFFYNPTITSIAAIPMNVQEAPFIFNLQTRDFQEVRVQGQLAYRVEEPGAIAEMLNFTLQHDGRTYVAEDPEKLSGQVVRIVQTIVQARIQAATLREALGLSQELVAWICESLAERSSLLSLGVAIVDVSVAAITASPETARALEAEAREAILQEADDAIYARRKSAVEQERTIREAELQTKLIVQDKEQQIEESRLENERTILRGRNGIRQEKLEADIDIESRRQELVGLNVANTRQEADAEAYAIGARMRAFRELPVENLRVLALGGMQADQLMATAFEALAQNADKIGELNIAPELFGKAVQKAVRK